jgi:hypothetical protein
VHGFTDHYQTEHNGDALSKTYYPIRALLIITHEVWLRHQSVPDIVMRTAVCVLNIIPKKIQTSVSL